MKIIVSTDSFEYAQISKKYGAEDIYFLKKCQDLSTDYEFVKVNEHKSHLNKLYLEKLGAEMESSFYQHSHKKIIVSDIDNSLRLVSSKIMEYFFIRTGIII